MNKQKIHFITYGDNKYKKSLKRIENEAINTCWFDDIEIYNPYKLTNEFKNKFGEILNQKRGGGYWIWKYDILNQKMKKINNGDILVYIDAGCKINKLGKKRFFEYIDALNNSNKGIISFKMKYIERNWTTKEIFEYFNINLESELAKTGQYVGGILLIKKNENSEKILDEYKKVLECNKLLFTDFYNKNQNIFFKDNRHDQSILSIIRKINGSIVIDDETEFAYNFKGKKKCESSYSLKFPFWAARLRM